MHLNAISYLPPDRQTEDNFVMSREASADLAVHMQANMIISDAIRMLRALPQIHGWYCMETPHDVADILADCQYGSEYIEAEIEQEDRENQMNIEMNP